MVTTNQKVNLRSINQAFAQHVLEGLHQVPKSLSSLYFYNDNGSRLFEAIMELDDYYPTRAEEEILQHQPQAWLQKLPTEPFDLIELGAGNGQKIKWLLTNLLSAGRKFSYLPIDVSGEALNHLQANLSGLPWLDNHFTPINAQYDEGLASLAANKLPKVVLFMGGNIGNFLPDQRNTFLLNLWHRMAKGDLLCIGFDLKKNINRLQRAYNDSEGITAQFNLNLLTRINEELGGKFDLNSFVFHSYYNPFMGAIESCLVSTIHQYVRIKALQCSIHFKAWEAIHTEYAFKYTIPEIEQLAEKTGFSQIAALSDSNNLFVDAFWQVQKL